VGYLGLGGRQGDRIFQQKREKLLIIGVQGKGGPLLAPAQRKLPLLVVKKYMAAFRRDFGRSCGREDRVTAER